MIAIRISLLFHSPILQGSTKHAELKTTNSLTLDGIPQPLRDAADGVSKALAQPADGVAQRARHAADGLSGRVADAAERVAWIVGLLLACGFGCCFGGGRGGEGRGGNRGGCLEVWGHQGRREGGVERRGLCEKSLPDIVYMSEDDRDRYELYQSMKMSGMIVNSNDESFREMRGPRLLICRTLTRNGMRCHRVCWRSTMTSSNGLYLLIQPYRHVESTAAAFKC